MPHPEHAVEDLSGAGTDGLGFFTSLRAPRWLDLAPAPPGSAPPRRSASRSAATIRGR